jgi:cellulose synthase/poly-beta-1,6-N-acetylglucosamine synthase-like glycosyltransferase
MNVRGLIDPLLGLLSLIVLVPAVVLCLELVMAWLRTRAVPAVALRETGVAGSALTDAMSSRTVSLAVLMPAHDEAAGIEAAIRPVLTQLGPRDRLLVVADNCSDATAAIARAAGAEVVERHDGVRRGKGYALDFGVRWLERDAPGVVVIVDADCIVAPGALERLATRCIASARPVQALYLMRAPAGASLGLRIAEFAWLVKNKLRPLGAAALGWPCQLMGTGMAFPWSLIERAPLASGHLVEDMQLGLDLATGGTPPLFCGDALVHSVFPTDSRAVQSQRTRWEHGHLSMIASAVPRLLGHALMARRAALLGMTLDLAVPPLASLVLAVVILAVVDALWWASGGSPLACMLATAALAAIGVGVMLAWTRDGRHIVTLRELMRMPLYVAAKIPVYARLFTKRQVEWVRTKRDDRSD